MTHLTFEQACAMRNCWTCRHCYWGTFFDPTPDDDAEWHGSCGERGNAILTRQHKILLRVGVTHIFEEVDLRTPCPSYSQITMVAGSPWEQPFRPW